MNILPCPFCGDIPKLPDIHGTQCEMYCDCGMAMSSVQISDLIESHEKDGAWLGNESRYKDIFFNRALEKVILQWNTRV